MKKIISILLFMIIASFINKANAQVDSMMLLRDSVYNNRAYYIGKPFSVLLSTLGTNVSITEPKSAGVATGGIHYYQNDVLYIGIKPNTASWDLDFGLLHPANVDLTIMGNMDVFSWPAYLSPILGPDTLVSLTETYPFTPPPVGTFTPATGWSLAQPASVTVNNGTVAVYVVVQGQPAVNWQTPFLIGTLSGTACLPQTEKTVSVFQGYTWGITINTDGTVYVNLVSSIAGMSPPPNVVSLLHTPITYNVP
jgi:hypothetical protein